MHGQWQRRPGLRRRSTTKATGRARTTHKMSRNEMRKNNKEQIVFELETLPPDLRDLPRECCPRQAENIENRRGELSSPAAWSSPGVGAQVASLQSLVLRPGPNQCSGARLAKRHPFSRKGASRPQERSLLRPLLQAHPALDWNSDFRVHSPLE